MAVTSNLKTFRGEKPLETKKLLLEYLKIYCKRSTVHGVKYIFDHQLTKFERFFWTIIVIGAISISFSSFLILFKSYRQQVILTVVDNSQYPIFNVPFPAVGVCNHERINWDKFNESKAIFLPRNSSKETLVAFREFVTRMESLRFGAFDQFNDSMDIDLEAINFVNVSELALFLSFRCEDMFDGHCSWRGDSYDCCELFVLEKTEVGYCLVFNSLISEASKEKKRTDPYYPWKDSKSGEGTGLGFQLRLNDSTSERMSDEDGIFLMIKKAEQWTDVVYSIKGNTDSLVVIKPELKTADPSTIEIAPQVRNCMFDSETNHYLFKNIKGLKYSQWNCFNACHEEYLLNLCKCTIPMFFPRNNSNRECTAPDFRCLYRYRDVFSYDKRLEEDKYVKNIGGGMLCPCLVRCEDQLQYFVTVSSLPIPDLVPNGTTRIMTVDVHYQSDSIIKYRTIREFTYIELIASLGGIVGLFMGASIISGIEIIYHLTFGLFMFLKDKQFFGKVWERLKICFNAQHHHTTKTSSKPPKEVWQQKTSNKRRRRY